MAKKGLKQKRRYFLTSVIMNLLFAGFSLGETVEFFDFRFITEPADTVVIKDSPAMLNCSATGKPPPVIQWKRDGSTLEFSKDDRRVIMANGSLFIHSVFHSRTERPDEGLYQCTATVKDIGTIISRSAKLQIASLSRFDQHPADTTLFLGQTVYFPCAIQGVPPAEIKWLKDEHLLFIDHSRMTVLPSGALEIDHVKSSDSGSYKCNASNVDKFRLSHPGILTVNTDYGETRGIVAPSFVAIPPKYSVVIKGTNLTLDCAANGSPKSKISWLKDGTTIDMSLLDSRYHVIGTGSLHIEKVDEQDEGNFMCRAENSEDSVDVSAYVDVQVPPYFVKKPKNEYAYEKEDIEFECGAYGRPYPTVRWVKNGEIIIQGEYFQFVNGHNLRILGLVKSDQGIYQCIASNPAGNIQSSVQLIILDPDVPTPTTPISITTTTNFHNHTGYQVNLKDTPSAPQNLTALIVSIRFVTLSWREPAQTNGVVFAYSMYYREEASSRERVLNTTGNRLEEINIQSLRPSTKYYFRVVAYNQHGPGQSSEEIFVQTHPEVHVPNSPKDLRASALNSTSILVQWKPPDSYSGHIEGYKLFYMEAGISVEHQVTTPGTQYILHALKKFTEYNFWVVAYNVNGPGQSTEEISARTYADAPSDMPQNVTLEPSSSTSIVVRWEPPPKESQNGIITGYKIRFKLKNSRRPEIKTTDGNRRSYALSGLEKGAQYGVKISALSVNGSGPSTDWMTVDTFQNDLDESRVPDQPGSLRARPSSNAIFLSWSPPKNQNIMIRGYTIGWGVGFPDVYTKVVEGKQRYYNIENLQPSSEYVISLRAYNQVGDGRPTYETVKTLIETTPEPVSRMFPPVELKAIVLTAHSVVLYWADTTLPRNQLVTDSRYYTVRYSSYSHLSSPKYRYFNSTDLNCMIDDLKPNTQYEFAVKVVKGRRESTWSMSVINSTQEAAPSSPPRDLTVYASEEDNSHINVHWQPPKQPNGHITDYVIYYTTDNTQEDRDWVVEQVVGDKMATILKGLTLDTTYYFKIQARNSKGYGPLSLEVMFHTAAGLPYAAGSSFHEGKVLTNNILYIVIASVCSVILVVIIVVSIIVCRQHQRYLDAAKNKSYQGSKGSAPKNKTVGKELNPPDLWIHHDQMELKSIEKTNNAETNMTVTPIPRNSQELGDEPLLNTMEKRKSTYLADTVNEDQVNNSVICVMKCGQIRATPINISLDKKKSKGPAPNGSTSQSLELGSSSMCRPLYPRTQYNITRAHAIPDALHPAEINTVPSVPLPNESQITGTYEQFSHVPLPQMSVGHPNTLTGDSCLLINSPHIVPTAPVPLPEQVNTGTLTKRVLGNPLKSFSVPAPPPQSAPTTPQPKHIVTKHQAISSTPKKLVIPADGWPSDSGMSSHPKNSQQPTLRPGVSIIGCRSSDTPSTTAAIELSHSYSSEKVNQDMVANLEGLMKDLNAITASEFEC